MSEDNAADIINAAAVRKTPDVEVVHNQRVLDPHRTVTVVLLGIPPCEQYPEGTKVWVHPRQVQAHIKMYPGAWVIMEKSKRMARKAVGSGVEAQGHGGTGHLEGRELIKSAR